MSNESVIRGFQQSIIEIAERKLARALSRKELAFVTSRAGFIALEAILDTVKAATPREVEQYLNSE